MKIKSDRILTLGPAFMTPKGGVAQVLYTYSFDVFEHMKHIQISGGTTKLGKIRIVVFACILVFFRLLLDRNIKIVHIHTASNNDFRRSSIFIRITVFFRKKLVVHIHGGGFKEYYSSNENYVRKMLDKADVIVALSEYWKKYFEDELRYSNVKVVHNIISSPNTNKKNSSKCMRLLYLGHIYEKKGIFDLVSLISQYREEYRGRLILDIGGGLFDVEKLKKILEDEDLNDLIVFHGWVGGQHKVDLLNSADAYILPSYAEGVPISILEAMSYSLPIISTNVGGIPGIIDNTNGILIEPGNLVEMKLAIDSLLCSEQKRINMGKCSYRSSLYYQPQNVTRELVDVYKSLD